MPDQVDLSNLDPSVIEEQREEYTGPHEIIITEDNCSLFLRSWPVDSDTDTAVLILHGITAHSKPYSIMAKPLNEAGYQVFGLDLRGHGLSSGNRGDYQTEDVLLSDLEATLSYIRTTLQYSNLILLGHSLGVLTSLKVLYHGIGAINGLAMFSAAEETREAAGTSFSFMEKLKIFISSIFTPSKPVITYYREGMLGLNDPLFNFRYTLRFFNIFDTDTIELPIQVNYPVYMAIGENDELFSIKAARELYDKIQSNDKEFHVIEDAKHAEFPQNAFDHFVEWLKVRF